MSYPKVCLGDVATFVNGYAFKPCNWSKNGLEIIRIQNLTSSSGERNFFQGELPTKYKVKRGDILISWSATLDIFVWEGEDAWLNQHIFKVVFDKQEVDKVFFFYLIKFVLNDMKRHVHGSTMKHITKDRFDNLKIPLPPLAIQKKIAAILDKADNLRQKDKQLLEHYNKLTQSIFYDMFGDPVRNEKGWDKHQLSSVCIQITDGTHFSPPPAESGAPYITAKHLKLSGIDFYSDPTYVSFEEHQKIFARCRPEKGDVLYIKDGATTGIAAINHYDFEFSMLSSLALIKPDVKKLNNYYLKSWLNHEKVKENLIRNYMAGAAIKRFTLSKINLFEIPLPPLPLQSEFKRKTEKIESSTSIVLKSYEQSNFLFQSLLQKAFKGELVKES